ncbi:hypothetical protein ACHQM5_022163 [Ranunculus cassubicifolius]
MSSMTFGIGEAYVLRKHQKEKMKKMEQEKEDNSTGKTFEEKKSTSCGMFSKSKKIYPNATKKSQET